MRCLHPIQCVFSPANELVRHRPSSGQRLGGADAFRRSYTSEYYANGSYPDISSLLMAKRTQIWQWKLPFRSLKYSIPDSVRSMPTPYTILWPFTLYPCLSSSCPTRSDIGLYLGSVFLNGAMIFTTNGVLFSRCSSVGRGRAVVMGRGLLFTVSSINCTICFCASSTVML